MVSLKHRLLLSPLCAAFLVFVDYLLFGFPDSDSFKVKLFVCLVVAGMIHKSIMSDKRLRDFQPLVSKLNNTHADDFRPNQEESMLGFAWILFVFIGVWVFVATVSGSIPLTVWHLIPVFFMYVSVMNYLDLISEHLGITVYNSVILRRCYILVALCSLIAVFYILINGKYVLPF